MSIVYKKPWLFAEYLDMMKTVDEAEVYNEGVNEKQSEFKKPYKHATHPNSENEFSGPGGGPGGVNWPTGGSWPGADCMPVGQAIGGGALNPCQPGLSCGQWAWTCAHKITKFNVAQSNGFIQSVTYGANDTVTATVCWDESFGVGKVAGSLVETANGAVFKATVPLDCLGPGHDNNCVNCVDCVGAGHVPVVQFTSQQMTLSGTQTFTVAGGGGGPYLWSIIAGGGTLSGGSGQTIVYTAPATNAECANNPTIRVKDFCGNIKDTKLAVTAGILGSNQAAIPVLRLGTPRPGGCGVGTPCPDCPQVIQQLVTCTNTLVIQNYCVISYSRGIGSGPPFDWHCCMESAGDCTDATWALLNAGCNCNYLDVYGDPPPGGSGDSTVRVVDIRTSAMKTGGCCPAILL
jgi:hypothetical protein